MADYRSEFDGIQFSEGSLEGSLVRELHVEISRQNSSITELKRLLAAQAHALGANAIANFRYGQKAHKGIMLIVPKWDTESWHGSGTAMVIDSEL